MNVQFADIFKLLIKIQFTNIDDTEDFRTMQHLFKLLNYRVPSMGFPHLTLFVGGGGEGGESMALLTTVNETNLPERSSTLTDTGEILALR